VNSTVRNLVCFRRFHFRRSELRLTQAERQGYDVELVASETTGNYCKGGVVSLQSGDYSYTHVWQPLSPAPSGIVRRPSEAAAPSSADQFRHHHYGDQTTARGGRMATMDAGEASGITATAGPGLCRHLCKDHVYESPSFESGMISDGALQWSPYYWHGATPCLLVSRQQGPTAAQSFAMPSTAFESADRMSLPHHQHHLQQQQQQQHYQHQYPIAGIQRGANAVLLPAGIATGVTGIPMPANGDMTVDNDAMSASYDATGVVASDGQRYTAASGGSIVPGIGQAGCRPAAAFASATTGVPVVAGATGATTVCGYEPVTCHGSPSSDPDVTMKQRLENQYT
jgi:hypothetical protein